MTTPPAPLLLTVQEVSKLLRIHRPKVYDLIRANIIEGFKLGSDWRVKRESLERLTGPIPDTFFLKTESDEASTEDDDAPTMKADSGRRVAKGAGRFE